MTYACVQDVASSWERYERVVGGLVDPAPTGMIVHIAGRTDDGVRMIDVWESEEAWVRFRADRLAPALAALAGQFPTEPTLRELRAEHVVFPHDPTSSTRGQAKESQQ